MRSAARKNTTQFTFAPEPGHPADNPVIPCPAGSGGAACAACPLGTYSAGGNTTALTPPCAACPAGSNTTSTGATNASACIPVTGKLPGLWWAHVVGYG